MRTSRKRLIKKMDRRFLSRVRFSACLVGRNAVVVTYDELILDYLAAVKQYVTEKPELQINYTFRQVLYQRLNGQMMHYWRKEHGKARTFEREAYRLDYQYENPEQERSGRIEPWWIDPMQDVERYVIEKEFIREIYANIGRYDYSEILMFIVDMRGKGYGNREIARKIKASLEEYSDWGIMDIVDLIKLLTYPTGKSPLEMLYNDTLEYGNFKEHQKWKEANKV